MFLSKDEIGVMKEYVYISYAILNKEIEERRNNNELQKKVRDFFGEHFLDVFDTELKAVLARTIFTPNLEFEYFLDLSKDFNLKPLLLEYSGKFVAKNIEKYHLCRLFFREHVGKRKGLLYSSKKIVDFNKDEGKDFSEIKTLDGQNFIDFHHQMLESVYPGMSKNIVPFSEWFNGTRYLTEHYYFYFFSLFVCNGVLFENFLIDDKEESVFIKNHVFSSFKKVHEHFGVKPMIVPLLPIENEKFRTWLSYRKDLKEFVENNK